MVYKSGPYLIFVLLTSNYPVAHRLLPLCFAPSYRNSRNDFCLFPSFFVSSLLTYVFC